MSLTPLLTSTPNTPPFYNEGMAETFSWVPIQGAGRPLYARATYLTNATDISGGGSISVTTTPIQSNTISSLSGPLTSNGIALSANASRKELFIMNTGMSALYVSLGSSASITNYAVVLGGGVKNDDGVGGSYDSKIWTGSVYVSGASPRYIAWELS